MPNEATPPLPRDEAARRIESDAATEILRMLTSDFVDTTGDCRSTRCSVRQETGMWF
ncbi:MAG: hypothetical protein ABI277_16515 [Burkholderiaceae bacterium]